MTDSKAKDIAKQRPARTGLARAMSKLGYCSRSAAQNLITEGRVRLNGRTVRDPEAPVRLNNDEIEVDRNRIASAIKTYLMMNKPRGLVTTAQDEKGRQTVYSLLPTNQQWLAPVGRLDKATEGLLLLTNDSQWSARITAPESHMPKTYHVQISAQFDEPMLAQLTAGGYESGERLRAQEAKILRHGEKNCWIEIVLTEGKNRHIRRMLAAMDTEVLRLVRFAIGNLQLGDLPKGKVRELTQREVKALGGAGKNV
jgi:23S rRNA pseudouridine2605 synthase